MEKKPVRADEQLIEISDWAKNYEKADGRKSAYSIWVAVPILFGTPEYTKLMIRKDGPSIYGVFVLLLHVAARGEPRGTLTDSKGRPLTIGELELHLRVPRKPIERAIEVLSSPEFGWVRVSRCRRDDIPMTSGQHPDYSTTQDKTRKDVGPMGAGDQDEDDRLRAAAAEEAAAYEGSERQTRYEAGCLVRGVPPIKRSEQQ